MNSSTSGDYLLVGFNLSFSLFPKHLFHEIELVDQAPHVWVLNKVGVRGLPFHLVPVDGLDRCLLQRVEQQL